MPSPFIQACRRQHTPFTPVWFMRQAGRSLPEFRALRERYSFFELLASPELTAEVTLQPVRRLGVDAAILFSDIVAPLAAIGVGVDIKPGVGPVFAEPFRSDADLARLRPIEPDEDLQPMLEAVRILHAELDVPLIGFGGAPFTMASYFVEGGPSREYARTKALMLGDPGLWRRLLDRLADLTIAVLRAQVGAGAAAVQVFDSWAGVLAPQHYERHVLPVSARIFDELRGLGAPMVHFGVTTGELLGLLAAAGPDVVGVDWRVPLGAAWQRVGAKAVQGNLDPAVLGAPWEAVAAEADAVLAAAAGRPGHVFNLGHGVLPDTDPDVLARLVDHVHARTAT
ncbi:MAG TPA: uroporphyrinogen decarboxylase [Acidimicrobiales bacterium]|nr:uroporphyrinogen decarboxylase [Acidimicrobiales bacterium]